MKNKQKIGEIYNSKQNTMVHVFKDAYNEWKVWCIKVNNGHYYVRQMYNAVNRDCYLNGRLVAIYDSGNPNNTKWERTTKRQLVEQGFVF